jgi:alpha-ketoglutarate-dependent 2,4-dichlorophenoxyacetate dioxygenase
MFSVEEIHEDLGGRVTGIDITQELDAATVQQIHGLIDQYSFVLFPNQNFDDEKHMAFTRALGEVEEGHLPLYEEGRLSYMSTIGNVKPDGSVMGNSADRMRFLSANNMWHTDSSFKPVPSYVSIMCAYEVPAEGGETLFASQRAAFGRLDAVTQARIDGQVAIHDYSYSRSKVAADVLSPKLAAGLPPVRQRLVRRNPNTGTANFYTGSHAKMIEGWSEAESRAMIEDLTARATADAHVLSHKWSPGDLVIWDNRCLLHRGAGYDADTYRRYMRQTRVKGRCNTLEE